MLAGWLLVNRRTLLSASGGGRRSERKPRGYASSPARASYALERGGFGHHEPVSRPRTDEETIEVSPDAVVENLADETSDGVTSAEPKTLVGSVVSRVDQDPGSGTAPTYGASVPPPPSTRSADSKPVGYIRLLGDRGLEGISALVVSGGSPEMWGLLGLLAEHRGRWLTKEAAIERLWKGKPPSAARFETLLGYVRGRLCEVVGQTARNSGRLVIEFVNGRGYRLNSDMFTCDVWQVRDLLVVAGKADVRGKADAVAAALELYGPYLDGLEYRWAVSASGKLQAELVHALVELAELEADAAPDRAVVYLEQAIELDPVNELLCRQQMKLYARLGRVGSVRQCYRLLDECLKATGARPDPQTTALHQRLTADA